MDAGTSDMKLWKRRGMRDSATVAEFEEFEEFVAARQQRLLRFAYLLTADAHTAEDIVQAALAKTSSPGAGSATEMPSMPTSGASSSTSTTACGARPGSGASSPAR